ncbi:hypothetical protein PAHAL_5G467800 [Panicum hallii]|uniref:Uncharacterized protein n=1 Tax=Panicum hallii TaxID=206008 RepID=A0A2S3HYA4_9POAL|nr:hypothetical protein PAHAL_5G467800 [Panicum hallii]
MCLWFACFGLHKHNDDCYAPPPGRVLPPPPPAGAVPAKPPHDGRPLQALQRNGYAQPQGAHYGNGYGHYQTAPGADEAGRKASNDARRGHAAAAVKYAPEKALAYTGAAETVRQPAWNGKVAEEAGHATQQQHYHYNYYYEREPAHKDAAMDCRHQYTAAATADHGRY